MQTLEYKMKAFEIWQSLSNPEHRKALEEQLHDLYTKSYSELINFPEITKKIIKTNSGSAEVNIYRNSLEQDILEIIVQLYIPGKNLILIKFAEVESTGFRISPNGSIENVPNEVVYGYM